VSHRSGQCLNAVKHAWKGNTHRYTHKPTTGFSTVLYAVQQCSCVTIFGLCDTPDCSHALHWVSARPWPGPRLDCTARRPFIFFLVLHSPLRDPACSHTATQPHSHTATQPAPPAQQAHSCHDESRRRTVWGRWRGNRPGTATAWAGRTPRTTSRSSTLPWCDTTAFVAEPRKAELLKQTTFRKLDRTPSAPSVRLNMVYTLSGGMTCSTLLSNATGRHPRVGKQARHMSPGEAFGVSDIRALTYVRSGVYLRVSRVGNL
jgi:hypothetical protein